jgi:magnesium-transporting ATPase (P-type)
MITGDQELSAISFAQQVGIIDNLDDLTQLMKDRENDIPIDEAERRSNVTIISKIF